MSDINFLCPKCNNPLCVSDEAAGMPLACPICNESITVPKKVIPQQPPEPIVRKPSLITNLRKSFSIALKKTKRTRLEHVDLRHAEVCLGKTAFDLRVLEDLYPDIYRRIDSLLEEAKTKSQQSQTPDTSLVKDTQRELGRAKSAILEKIQYRDLDNAYVFFGQKIYQYHSSESALGPQIQAVRAIASKIAAYDADLLDLSRNAGYLVRHPAVLLASCAFLLIITWFMYCGARDWWELHQARKNADAVVEQSVRSLNQLTIETQEAKEKAELAIQTAKKAQAERDLANAQKRTQSGSDASGGRNDTSASDEAAKRRNDQLQEQVKSVQAQLDQQALVRDAGRLFGTISITPNVVTDKALGATSVALKGEYASEIVSFYQTQNWRGLVELLDRNSGASDFSAKTVNSCYERLARMNFQLHIKSASGSPPNYKVYCLRFKDTDPDASFDYNTRVERHPSDYGILVPYRLQGERLVLLVGPNTYVFQRQVLDKFQEAYQDQYSRLKKRKQLGEINADQLEAEIRTAKEWVYGEIVKRAGGGKPN